MGTIKELERKIQGFKKLEKLIEKGAVDFAKIAQRTANADYVFVVFSNGETTLWTEGTSTDGAYLEFKAWDTNGEERPSAEQIEASGYSNVEEWREEGGEGEDDYIRVCEKNIEDIIYYEGYADEMEMKALSEIDQKISEIQAELDERKNRK